MVWGAVLSLMVVGCAQTSVPLAELVSGLWQAGALGGSGDLIPAKPDLRFAYLRVQVEGNTPALLVLGNLDPQPDGVVEVWYSGSKEALRLKNGRIVGMTGATYDWSAVRVAPLPPAWADVGTTGFEYTRTRDQMPGYAFGVADKVTLSRWNGLPPTELLRSLPEAKAQTYQWYREQSQPMQGSKRALPDAWFAWGKHRGAYTVVYSEQCLAPDFCLRMQRWPVMEEAQ